MVVDDHPVVRRSIVDLLETEADAEVVAVCVDGQEAADTVESTGPEVILMGLSMPRLDGVQATIEILRRHPDIRIWIHTASPGGRRAEQALAAGATGVLIRGTDPDTLCATLCRR